MMTRSTHRSGAAAVSLAIGLLASAAAADPPALARRTAGILVSDSGLDAIYLLDLEGSATLFFDGSNASGLPAPTGLILSMYQRADGTVFLGDGDTDTIYAVRDLNLDGDALDPGEARIYFSAANAAGIGVPTPNGIAEISGGGLGAALYIANAGVSSQPTDAIIRTIDLNFDGDALDPGEQAYWADLTALGVASSSPFEAAAVGSSIYFIDPRGGASDVVFRATDTDGSGAISADELTIFYDAGAGLGAPISLALQTDGTSLYIHEQASGPVQSVWRLTDLDASGSINQPNEAVEVWSENSLPAGEAMGNSFSFALGPSRLALGSNGTDPLDEVILAHDLDNNGDFNDAGGTSILIQGAAATGFPENVRAVMFYATPCLADVNASGGEPTVQDIFDFLALYFASSPLADINGLGGTTVQDIFDFLAHYFGGCP